MTFNITFNITKKSGFTLIEMLVVVAIIAIMATLSVPLYTNKIIAAQMSEAFGMLDEIKPGIKSYYRAYGNFPEDNTEVGLPKPEFLIGNYVKTITIEKGSIHILFGNKVHSDIKDKILSIRPQTVIGSPMSPISWACGNAEPPEGMSINSPNKTDIDLRYLPFNCR